MNKSDPSGLRTIAAHHKFVELCRTIGGSHVAEETAILAIGREFLPPFAVAVRDGTGEATAEYYEWLTEQTQAAQDEHDAEVAAGHEWHDRDGAQS